MSTPFDAPSFTWPFRVAMFAPALAFLVMFGCIGIILLWGMESLSPAEANAVLAAVWIAFVATGIAEVLALVPAGKRLLFTPEARTTLNFLAFFAGVLAIVLAGIAVVVGDLTRNAI